MVQELGRAWQWEGASPSTDTYWLVVSLKSFASILFQIYIVPKINKRKAVGKAEGEKELAEENNNNYPQQPTVTVTVNLTDTVSAAAHVEPVANVINLPLPELQARQYKNLIEVLQIVCLHPGTCIHYKLEQLLVNLFVAALLLDDSDPW